VKVTVSSIAFDLTGYASFDPLADSDYGAMIRRANKVRTLDGGVAINDYGYTDGDRAFEIKLRPDPTIDAALRYLVEYHPLVNVSTKDGFFIAVPISYEQDGAISTLTLSITERVA